MIFDLYAYLACKKELPVEPKLPASLASGFVDKCTYQYMGEGDRNKARQCYIEHIKNASQSGFDRSTLDKLELDADVEVLPDPSWLAFKIAFKLQTPWYSKDDRLFHVINNPVRKDRVFGIPYMSAASWKGLLRWACRMQAGLRSHLEKHGGKLEEWSDPPWIIHLFGNEKEEDKNFQRGALAFRPTWFSQIGVEVINPHSRETRAGTMPIYYEVVPTGAEGTLRLLYAPLPRSAEGGQVNPAEVLGKLMDAINQLLTKYGISAKRTVGWGTATITKWEAGGQGNNKICGHTLDCFKKKLTEWVEKVGSKR